MSTIYLLDATENSVEGQLHDAIENAHIDDWLMRWAPLILMRIQRLARDRVPMAKWPQSWHWNWQEIASNAEGLLAYRYFSVVAKNVTQGLMRVVLTKTCRVAAQAGKPLVYVDLVEAAPWNQPNSGDVSRLRGVGTVLISAAIALSVQEGFEGRIGLHSLLQAVEFYRDKCGMTDLGTDYGYGGLRYFEMTSAQAQAFLE